MPSFNFAKSFTSFLISYVNKMSSSCRSLKLDFQAKILHFALFCLDIFQISFFSMSVSTVLGIRIQISFCLDISHCSVVSEQDIEPGSIAKFIFTPSLFYDIRGSGSESF